MIREARKLRRTAWEARSERLATDADRVELHFPIVATTQLDKRNMFEFSCPSQLLHLVPMFQEAALVISGNPSMTVKQKTLLLRMIVERGILYSIKPTTKHRPLRGPTGFKHPELDPDYTTFYASNPQLDPNRPAKKTLL